MTKLITRLGGLALAGVVLAGCAGETGATGSPSAPAASAPAASAPAVASGAASAPASSAPVSSAPAAPPRSPDTLPTMTRPAGPPKEPTDNAPNDGWVTGMVTRGGSGPCYGLADDEGNRYALYSTTGIKLAKGERVKVLLETTMLRIYCGPGDLMAMTEAKPIR